MGFKAELFLTLQRLLTSRKFITLIAGLITGQLARHHIILAPEDMTLIITVFTSLILAQGAADVGKGAAYVAAANPPPPTQTQTVSVDTTASGGDEAKVSKS